MSKPQDKVFANLSTQLPRDLPWEPRTRLVNLAAGAPGILRRKSRQGGQILTALPLAGPRDTRKQSIQRFLRTPSVAGQRDYTPLARRMLQRLAGGGARLHVTIDRTEGGTSHLLSSGSGWWGRALPRLGPRLGPGASSVAAQKERSAGVARRLPRGAGGLLLGDRACGTGLLAQGALRQGWGVCLRWRAHEDICRAGAPSFEHLPLGLPGDRRFWAPVPFLQKPAASGLTLALDWAPAAAAPWSRIPSAPPGSLACASSHKRVRIEAIGKDCNHNGRGVGLELPGVRHADRWERVRLAWALGYSWLLLWGAGALLPGQHKVVDNVRNLPLRAFQTGLRFVHRLWQRGHLGKCHWHLTGLAGADK